MSKEKVPKCAMCGHDVPKAEERQVMVIQGQAFLLCDECSKFISQEWGKGRIELIKCKTCGQAKKLKLVPYKKPGRPKGIRKGAYGTAKLEDFIKRGKNGSKKTKASLDANDMQGQAGTSVQRGDSTDDSPGGEIPSGRHPDDIRVDRDAVPLEVGQAD